MLPVVPSTRRAAESRLLTAHHALHVFVGGFFSDGGEIQLADSVFRFDKQSVYAVERYEDGIVVLEQTAGVVSISRHETTADGLRQTASLRLSQELDVSALVSKDERVGQMPISAASLSCSEKGARVALGTISGQLFVWPCLPWEKWTVDEHYIATPCVVSGIPNGVTNVHMTEWQGAVYVFASTIHAIYVYEARSSGQRTPAATLVWKEVALGARPQHTTLADSRLLLKTLGVQRVTQGSKRFRRS